MKVHPLAEGSGLQVAGSVSGTSLALVPDPQEMELLATLGNELAASGCFPDVKGGAQAVVKILAGREYGVPPIEAMRSFHIMHDGKIEPAADLLARAVKGHPIYDYRVLVHSDEECSIRFTERDEILGVSRFTVADAKQAGLLERGPSGKPGAWEKYPLNMLFNRAMTNGVAWLCPDVLSPPRMDDVPPMPFGDPELIEDAEGAGDTTASTPSADTAGSEEMGAGGWDVGAEAEQPGAGASPADDGQPDRATLAGPAPGTAAQTSEPEDAGGTPTGVSEPADGSPSAELANRALRHFVTRPKILAAVRAEFPDIYAVGGLKDYSDVTHAQMVTALEAGLKVSEAPA